MGIKQKIYSLCGVLAKRTLNVGKGHMSFGMMIQILRDKRGEEGDPILRPIIRFPASSCCPAFSGTFPHLSYEIATDYRFYTP